MRTKVSSITLLAGMVSVLLCNIPSVQASYNPQAAVDYANTWWDGRNSTYPGQCDPYKVYDADCDNFVSQCLIAGGLDLSWGSDWWWDECECIISCTELNNYLVNICAEHVSWAKGHLPSEPEWFLPGDVAIFGYTDGNGNVHAYAHSVIAVTGDQSNYTTCNGHSTDMDHRSIEEIYQLSASFDDWPFDRCTFYHIPRAFSGAVSGTEADPYVITNVAQLQEMNDNLSAWYELGNDIDAGDTKNWNGGAGFIPIGDSTQFTGHFDGKGYKVVNLFINKGNRAGLFGRIDLGADIRNVGLVAVDLSGSGEVGGLVAFNNHGSVSDSYCTGSVFSSAIGSNGVGGLVGFNIGEITASYFSGNVTGGFNVGGLVGLNYGDGGNISRCYSTGNVQATSSLNAIGGLVGANGNGGSITDSYSEANVSGGRFIGGLVGSVDAHAGPIVNCYSAGSVSSPVAIYKGGLVGIYWGTPCNNCFWDVQTSGQETSPCGTGKSTAEMKHKATFTNWDFDYIWDIRENVSYPFLMVSERPPKPHSPVQTVVLNWERNVPVQIDTISIFGMSFPLVIHGTMPALSGLTSDYKNEVLQRVQRIFADSGIDNVVITENPTEKATSVFFTEQTGDLLGYAYDGVDRFNKRSDDEVVVFALKHAEVDAESVAHEVGHALGLRHVDPDVTVDPYNASVMDDDYVPDVKQEFINAISDITDFLSPYSHNPVYHLKRYVDRISHNHLTAQGINPGSWDVGLWELIKTHLDSGTSSRFLYNLSLQVGESDDSMTTIAYFPEISLSQLSELEFTIPKENTLRLLGSSTKGGDLDTILMIGDPYDQNNLAVQPIDGEFEAYLQTESIPPPGYVTITEITVSGTVFEPKLCNSDFNRDGDVDLFDLCILNSNWLKQDCSHSNCWCDGVDLNYSGSVDFLDFTTFARNWLWEKIISDFDFDGDVDFADYVILSSQWLQPPALPSADIAPEILDGVVDMLDLTVLAKHWLEGIQ